MIVRIKVVKQIIRSTFDQLMSNAIDFHFHSYEREFAILNVISFELPSDSNLFVIMANSQKLEIDKDNIDYLQVQK